MNKILIVVMVSFTILHLSGCSSINSKSSSGNNPGSSTSTAISDQRIASNEFKRQGIKIFYTLNGKLDAIEATGYSPVWGNSENAIREAYRVAELEAKKSLNDFINQETIASAVSVKMISQNLEQARDQKNNRFNSNQAGSTDELVATDDAVDKAKIVQTTREDNMAVRNDALRISSIVNTTITNTNQGILGGLYLVDGQAINNGKNVRVVMRWDPKHADIRNQVRNLMMR
jgi:hypothetical protein